MLPALVLAIALAWVGMPWLSALEQDGPEERRDGAAPVENGTEDKAASPTAENKSPAGSPPRSGTARQDGTPGFAAEHPGSGDNQGQPSDSAGRKPGGGRVLLPGGQAWNPPKAPAPRQMPTGTTPDPPRRDAAPAEPTRPRHATAPEPAVPGQAHQQLDSGVIYWTGKLEKNLVVIVEPGKASAGTVQGDLLPGVPIDVKTPSPAVVIVDQPGPQNEWRRFSFRCLKSTRRSVTVNLQWYRLN